MARRRVKEGDVYKIELGDGTHVYAREATFSSSAYYDSRTTCDLPIDEIVKFPVLFFVCVFDEAIKQGRWKLVGNRSLHDAPLPQVPPKAIRRPYGDSRFAIYFNDGRIRETAREEIEGLEPAMIWSPEKVEARLRDYYLGYPERWKDSLAGFYQEGSAQEP
jgi:hypothetical protein